MREYFSHFYTILSQFTSRKVELALIEISEKVQKSLRRACGSFSEISDRRNV